MPERNIAQLFIVMAKGLAMGAADVVPGVSGGTIAFISGIYEELIETIHKLDFKFFKIWKQEGFLTAWRKYNLSFLFALLLGIAISILSFSKLIMWLLETYPVLVWAFFFGLVLASILYIGKQIRRWRPAMFLVLFAAVAVSYLITVVNPVSAPGHSAFLFFSGFIAIIAMILPGISGSYILLLIGSYTTVIGFVTQFGEGILTFNPGLISQASGKLLIFAAGAVIGLKLFSRTLNWMFKNHQNLTLVVLTGFMTGALNKIWPWKSVLEYRTDSSGNLVPYLEKSIMPQSYNGDPQIFMALIFAGIGFLTIFFLEQIATKKKKTTRV